LWILRCLPGVDVAFCRLFSEKCRPQGDGKEEGVLTMTDGGNSMPANAQRPTLNAEPNRTSDGRERFAKAQSRKKDEGGGMGHAKAQRPQRWDLALRARFGMANGNLRTRRVRR
jgi:hypothetical protein